ncbi:MAG: hypothetical protein JST05_01120 [Acidobacteria bacterium]|nr:hypothetical protein [Acidobacteriota bacterium]
MVQPSDLPPLAQDTTLQATNSQLAAMEATLGTLATQATATAALSAGQDQTAIKATQVQVSLVAALVDSPVPLGTLTSVHRMKVKAIAGAPASLSLKMGLATEAPVDLDATSDWTDIAAAALLLNAPATAGGSVTLQLWGR